MKILHDYWLKHVIPSENLPLNEENIGKKRFLENLMKFQDYLDDNIKEICLNFFPVSLHKVQRV